MKLRGLKANNRWHIHLVERCPTCPTLSMPSFYSPKEVQAVTPGHLCFCNALKLGSKKNTSWWFFTNPSEKYARQNWIEFPQVLGWKIKNVWVATTVNDDVWCTLQMWPYSRTVTNRNFHRFYQAGLSSQSSNWGYATNLHEELSFFDILPS